MEHYATIIRPVIFEIFQRVYDVPKVIKQTLKNLYAFKMKIMCAMYYQYYCFLAGYSCLVEIKSRYFNRAVS